MHELTFGMDENHCQMLRVLGAATNPATAAFRKWLGEIYPNWTGLDDFCRCVPASQTTLTKGDYCLGYVWPEDWIMQSAQQWVGSGCLPIGSLCSGSWLAIDCTAPDSLFIGCFPIELFYEDAAPKLTELDFVPFDMSYGQWLRHSYEFPEDNRYS